MSKSSSFVVNKAIYLWNGVKGVVINDLLITLTIGLVRFAMGCFISTFMSLYNNRLDYLGYKGIATKFIVPSRYLITLCFSLLFGHFSEWTKLGRTYICPLGLFCIGLGNLISAKFTGLGLFLTSIFLFGVGVGGTYTGLYAIMADYYPKERFTFALFLTELLDSVAWACAPAIFSKFMKSDTEKDYFTPMMIFGSLQVFVSFCALFVFYFKVRKMMIEESKAYKDTSLPFWAKLKLIFTTRVTLMAFGVSVIGGCIYYCHISAIGKFYPVSNGKGYLIGDILGPVTVITAIFMESFQFKEYYVIYCNVVLAILIFFSGDNPVDKTWMSKNAQFGIFLFIVIMRNFVYYILYLYANVLFMMNIGYPYRKNEVSGIATAIYTSSLTLGNSAGLIITNLYRHYGLKFHHVTITLTIMLACSFIYSLLVYYIGRKPRDHAEMKELIN